MKKNMDTVVDDFAAYAQIDKEESKQFIDDLSLSDYAMFVDYLYGEDHDSITEIVDRYILESAKITINNREVADVEDGNVKINPDEVKRLPQQQKNDLMKMAGLK